MVLNYKEFLDKLNSQIKNLGIDLADSKIDHLAYQASNDEEYDSLKIEFNEIAELVREPIVGGRRVGVYKLKNPLEYDDQKINAIELIAPKAGQSPNSGLEHAEYLLSVSLEEFINKYPKIDWDLDALNREQFPMLILRLDENTRVKFPRNPILSE